VILSVPSAPVSLQENTTITSINAVGFTFSNGASTGGSAIIDYRIWYDQSINNWIVLDTNVTTLNYTTKVVLTIGATYQFRVEARNTVGFSSQSSILTILAAQVPDKPAAPITISLNSNVVITW